MECWLLRRFFLGGRFGTPKDFSIFAPGGASGVQCKCKCKCRLQLREEEKGRGTRSTSLWCTIHNHLVKRRKRRESDALAAGGPPHRHQIKCYHLS